MDPDLETRQAIYRGLLAECERAERLCLRALKSSQNSLQLDSPLSFSAGDRWVNSPLSPEHHAYLNQVRPGLSNSNFDSKLIPFCDSELSASAPRWKMAVLTWVGVCFTVGVLGLLLGRWMTSFSWFTNLLVFNAAVVLMLTWVVMPVLTWSAQRWLRSS